MHARFAKITGLVILLAGLLLASMGQARQFNWRSPRTVHPPGVAGFKGNRVRPRARGVVTKAPLRKHRRWPKSLAKTAVGLGRLTKALRPSEMTTWAVSSTTLGVAEATYITSKTSPLISGLQRLGFWGGLGLTFSAARDMKAAKTTSERLDAAGDLAWGLEGAFEFTPVFSGGLGKLAPIVGTIGGFCQTGAGLRRVWQGVRQRDWCKVKLGALDVASGGLWLAWDLFGVENPVTICGFVGLMIGREVYANREAIKASFKRGANKLKRGIRRTRARARLMKRKVRRWHEHRRELRQQRRLNNLHHLGGGLDR